MEILYVLIPLSLVAMFGVIGVFAWALHNDQFDDLEGEGARALQLPDAPQAGAGRTGPPDAGIDAR
jgi:cbb3-type cytochrome oxidase maturation protein